MRIGAVTMAYRDAETIRGTLACLSPFVEKHIVMVNQKPYNGQEEPMDDTLNICSEFKKVEIIQGNWEEHMLRNIAHNVILDDMDWVLGFDADEMMSAADLEKLFKFLETTDKNAVGFISKVYWRTTDYRFEPDPDHVKVCVTRPGKVKYTTKQCVDSPYAVLNYREEPFITHHHLSYCEPKNILRKVLTYNHADEFNGQEWYDKHYKDWKFGEPVVQPFGTKWEAVKEPLPEELRRLL